MVTQLATEPPAHMDVSKTSTTEEIDIPGEQLLDDIERLIAQGNVQRIVIQNAEGCALIKIPIFESIVGTVSSLNGYPESAAIEVIAAIVPYPHLIVERSSH